MEAVETIVQHPRHCHLSSSVIALRGQIGRMDVAENEVKNSRATLNVGRPAAIIGRSRIVAICPVIKPVGIVIKSWKYVPRPGVQLNQVLR